ncbi:MAG: Nif3-like dinuclear metal center hexameric protein [Bacteroidales bacterium]|nr:Nif3-like dinuclear metal center hexameric protein [Bacteroidales bacterium]MBQ5640042.1 Nif3-like dinuclear metal center hexameric protein [Bacteroidales bacterium]
MKVRDIMALIEGLAPLHYQDEWDNCGLQVGLPDADVSKVLVCLDVTEEIVDEAVRKGCEMIVSHHPLIFKALKQVSCSTYQQRCVMKAIGSDIAIYSAHTSLDNAPGGVNYEIASRLGLQNISFLSPSPSGQWGSGVVGDLSAPLSDDALASVVKERFAVEALRCSQTQGREIKRVAVCGGSGAFLMKDALRAGADCFVCGEFHYHDYFENDGLFLLELGHYQSEQYTIDVLARILEEKIEVYKTEICTNPICYK